MPGPLQKPAGTRARRNTPTAHTTTLPAQGRGGKKAPPWPLRADMTLLRDKVAAELKAERLREKINDVSDRRTIRRLEAQLDAAIAEADTLEAAIDEQTTLEGELWAELWATPQATMWERNGWLREVALYVRVQLRSEDGDLKAAAEARQRSDRLGLSPRAMNLMKWEIERTDEAVAAGRQRRAAAKAPAKKAAGRKKTDPRQALRLVN